MMPPRGDDACLAEAAWHGDETYEVGPRGALAVMKMCKVSG